MKTLKLTTKQAEALLWAIDLTQSSFDGWTREDIGKDNLSDLQALARVSANIITAFEGEANA
jgi:hypothetical protein